MRHLAVQSAPAQADGEKDDGGNKKSEQKGKRLMMPHARACSRSTGRFQTGTRAEKHCRSINRRSLFQRRISTSLRCAHDAVLDRGFLPFEISPMCWFLDAGRRAVCAFLLIDTSTAVIFAIHHIPPLDPLSFSLGITRFRDSSEQWTVGGVQVFRVAAHSIALQKALPDRTLFRRRSKSCRLRGLSQPRAVQGPVGAPVSTSFGPRGSSLGMNSRV